jgi:hypothetical protein
MVKVKRRQEGDFAVTRCRWDREGRIDALALVPSLDLGGFRGAAGVLGGFAACARRRLGRHRYAPTR